MSPEVKSEEDTLEFDHMKKATCEDVCSHVHLCEPAHGTLTHTPRHGHAAIGNLSLVTAGMGSRAIVT